MNSWSICSQYTSGQASCQEEKHVVKRFYRRFRTEHSIFQALIQGIASENEINPDILGSILEQYVNQKQMGAYYTKEDISEYIAKNTIIPLLFSATEKKCPVAFEQHGPIWRLLRNNPDRYIYEAVRCEGYLPTETEREYATRRGRYAEIKARMLAGEVISINDLATYNLDIRCFAQDVIESCKERGLLRALIRWCTRGDGHIFCSLRILSRVLCCLMVLRASNKMSRR